jgi:heat shock protein HslJ/LysM repeat protein
MMRKMIVSLVFITLLVSVLSSQVLAQKPVQCQEEYTVQRGDWLSKISEKYFGDVLAYPALVQVNNADSGDAYTDIVDPDLIEPGWVLCIPSGEDMAQLMAMSVGTVPAGLAPADLTNATYQGIYEQPVTLTNGTYEGEPFVEGGASRPTVTFIPDPVAYGDVPGDDQNDAAVLLAENSGGSGTFVYLAVVVNQDGQPVNVATILLGDRAQVQSMKIENKQIAVNLIQHGPDDPMCCPSQQVIKTFALQGDQLVEVSSEEVSAAATLELIGPVWRWDQTLMNNGDKFVPNNPNNYTVQFMPDGTVAIQADCNRVGGTYTLDGSAITIELGPTTLVACPPDSLGDQFVANLGAAAIYFFQGENLFIDLKFDSGTMQFSARSNVLAGTSWSVTGYFNGQSGVVSPIIGTELTATFGQDGNLTGSAGCNDYSTTYQVDGSTITIGPPISTLMECAEPEGVMEQELLYLTALGTAATYAFQGEFLEMRTAEGSLAVTFEPAP